MNDQVVMAVSPTLNSILQFITLMIVFVLILLATYWTTRFVGNYQKITGRATNFEVIETYRVTSNKYLQIIRTGSRYLVISVCKDDIRVMTELSKEEIVIPPPMEAPSFSEIMEKVKKNKLFEKYKSNADISADSSADSCANSAVNSADSKDVFCCEQEGKEHCDDDEEE